MSLAECEESMERQYGRLKDENAFVPLDEIQCPAW
jgi:hypothetical protein